MTSTILDILAEQFHCYISSLPSLAHTPSLAQHLLLLLDDDAFSKREWNDALTYLYRDVREEYAWTNKAYIREFLEKRKAV